MKISVVTISYNQARFLRECIDSVLAQDYPDVEYIVVDPGSLDESRSIIESYGDRIIRVFEKDDGPADGLNRGFKRANGEILCYLNSDDVFMPGAFSSIVEYLSKNQAADVLCGHARVIDEESRFKRHVFSDSFSLSAAAYGACVCIQPSTFFRREIFEKVNGFNTMNRSSWDGELLIDMALAGANVVLFNQILSCYRVHEESITGSGRLALANREYVDRMFEKIKGRAFRKSDRLYAVFHWLVKHVVNYRDSIERVRRGPVFGSCRPIQY